MLIMKIALLLGTQDLRLNVVETVSIPYHISMKENMMIATIYFVLGYFVS